MTTNLPLIATLTGEKITDAFDQAFGYTQAHCSYCDTETWLTSKGYFATHRRLDGAKCTAVGRKPRVTLKGDAVREGEEGYIADVTEALEQATREYDDREERAEGYAAGRKAILSGGALPFELRQSGSWWITCAREGRYNVALAEAHARHDDAIRLREGEETTRITRLGPALTEATDEYAARHRDAGCDTPHGGWVDSTECHTERIDVDSAWRGRVQECKDGLADREIGPDPWLVEHAHGEAIVEDHQRALELREREPRTYIADVDAAYTIAVGQYGREHWLATGGPYGGCKDHDDRTDAARQIAAQECEERTVNPDEAYAQALAWDLPAADIVGLYRAWAYDARTANLGAHVCRGRDAVQAFVAVVRDLMRVRNALEERYGAKGFALGEALRLEAGAAERLATARDSGNTGDRESARYEAAVAQTDRWLADIIDADHTPLPAPAENTPCGVELAYWPFGPCSRFVGHEGEHDRWGVGNVPARPVIRTASEVGHDVHTVDLGAPDGPLSFIPASEYADGYWCADGTFYYEIVPAGTGWRLRIERMGTPLTTVLDETHPTATACRDAAVRYSSDPDPFDGLRTGGVVRVNEDAADIAADTKAAEAERGADLLADERPVR